MKGELTKPIKIFYSYAREDKKLREDLAGHLEPLRRSGQIEPWYDREILAGQDWKGEIDKHLNGSDIILLLISRGLVINAQAALRKALSPTHKSRSFSKR